MRKVCQKFLAEYETPPPQFHFDATAAERVIDFCHLFKHTNGAWAGQHFTLEPWQIFFVLNVFGWKRQSDDTRRYRKALLYVPRKNGKTLFASILALYMLTADNEPGAQIYCAATTQKQAMEVLDTARILAINNPQFLAHFRLEVQKETIKGLTNKFEALIGSKEKDGTNPHMAVVDELHQASSTAVFDSLQTGMGARRQPLLLVTTTAGTNTQGPCFNYVHEIEQNILQNLDTDTFASFYTLDLTDDFKDINLAKKANPNLGVSIYPSYIESQLNECLISAQKLPNFKTKHLNIWHGSAAGYFDMNLWRECGDNSLSIDQFVGEKCWLGLDLSAVEDITSIAIVFRKHGHYYPFSLNFLPSTKTEYSPSNNFYQWSREGFIESHEGSCIDYSLLEQTINDLSEKFQVVEISADPHMGQNLLQNLAKNGQNVVQVRQIISSMSEPMTSLDMLIRQKKISHNCNPVLGWCMENVVAREYNGLVAPNKTRSANKIDAAVALIIALKRAMVDVEETNNDWINFV